MLRSSTTFDGVPWMTVPCNAQPFVTGAQPRVRMLYMHAYLLLSTMTALSTDLWLLICVCMRDDAVPTISLLRYERSCHTLWSAEKKHDSHAESHHLA
jgi:hypothetical protein